MAWSFTRPIFSTSRVAALKIDAVPKTDVMTKTEGMLKTEGVLKTKMLRASATIDFPSIAAQSAATVTVTVVGAAVGDDPTVHVAAGPTAGLIYSCWVSATDTLSVRAINYTVLAVDAPSAVYRLIVWKA